MGLSLSGSIASWITFCLNMKANIKFLGFLLVIISWLLEYLRCLICSMHVAMQIDSPTRVGLHATGAAEDDDLARAVSLSLKVVLFLCVMNLGPVHFWSITYLQRMRWLLRCM